MPPDDDTITHRPLLLSTVKNAIHDAHKKRSEESLAYFDSCYIGGTPPQSSTILTHLDSFQMICHGNKREGRVEPIYSFDWQNLMMMMALFIFFLSSSYKLLYTS